jgi:hypothetical protein
MFSHEALEGGAVNPEGLRGARDVSVVLRKGFPEELLLEALQSLLPPGAEVARLSAYDTFCTKLGQGQLPEATGRA